MICGIVKKRGVIVIIVTVLTVAFAAAILFGMVMSIIIFIKIKNQNPKALIYYFSGILCIFIMVASWILNLGWLRVILTWILFPFIHLIFFAIVNANALFKLAYCNRLKWYTILSHVTYVGTYLFLPDFGDIGPARVFFGLIKNNNIALSLMPLSLVCFLGNIVFLILQASQRNKVKAIADLNI